MTDQEAIAAAVAKYQSDDLEVQRDEWAPTGTPVPLVSHSEPYEGFGGGAWVLSWVWVENPED